MPGIRVFGSAQPQDLRRVVLGLVGGLAALAIGITFASRHIGEWQPVVATQEDLREQFEAIAKVCGVTLNPGLARMQLSTDASESALIGDAKKAGEATPRQAEAQSTLIDVSTHGFMGRENTEGDLIASFTFTGQLIGVRWNVTSLSIMMSAPPVNAIRVQQLAVQLFAPHKDVRWGTEHPVGPHVFRYAEILPDGREHLIAYAFSGGNIQLRRRLGGTRSGEAEIPNDFSILIGRLAVHLGALLPFFLLQVVTFLLLLFRRRIDLVNGAWLAGLVFLSQVPFVLKANPGPTMILNLFSSLVAAIWLLISWSTGESVLRAGAPDFTTSLDGLRRGRLGPRAGRSLLLGLGVGAAVAGAILALGRLVAESRLLWSDPLVPLPFFDATESPFGNGIRLAAGIMLLLGLGRLVLPPRWVVPGVTLVGALCLSPGAVHPYWAGLCTNLLVIALLVVLGRRSGLTALLCGSITLFAAPAAALGFTHLSWLIGSSIGAALPLILILIVAVVALGRPERIERERMEPPAFMKRLEEERRLRYEMDLLSRMQLGLLPTDLPRPAGWDIAARSVLATEASGDLYDFLYDDAGRLWVAAGDVAGHGYSCSIVQAMTTAALSSVIGPDRLPSDVLAAIDRVLRRGGTRRNFTSLALLRLDLLTGHALLGNAGHPPLWLLRPGNPAEEIQSSALPLGQGPARIYRNAELVIPPGGVVVFCSDGLYEATDGLQEAYGYDQPKAVIERDATKTAQDIVEGLLADWGRHRGNQAPSDDTTVVVIKRRL
jgi:hypothetical protein